MIWWINYDFNWVRWLDEFHEHKISNTGWVWNGDERERSGTEQNRRECSTFLNLHFLDQKWSEDLELALANWEDSANPGKCTIYTVMSADSTVQFAHKNKAGKSMQWGESSFKRAQRCLDIKYGEVSLQYEFATSPPKPQPLYEMKWKGKQGKCSQTNST